MMTTKNNRSHLIIIGLICSCYRCDSSVLSRHSPHGELAHAFIPCVSIAKTSSTRASSLDRKRARGLDDPPGSRMEGRITPREMIPPTNSIADAATAAAVVLNSATSNGRAAVAALTKTLYPASMIGTLGEAYFRTRKEMGCPRGAAVGYIAQILTILISIPMISIVKSSSPDIHSILQVDWLHFIESVLFWASIHVQCMSFREVVGNVERGEPSLPASALHYKPKTISILLLFGVTLVIAMGHYFSNPSSWHNTQLFGGWFNPPTPGRDFHMLGELSFLTWIFHWSMIMDYIMQLRCMWRWGDLTGNEKWKLYTLLHLPACLVNGIVLINHLHRDQITALRLLHPILVFVGSIATCYGSYAVAHINGWSMFGRNANGTVDGMADISFSAKDNLPKLIKGSDLSYTLASFAMGSLLAYCSLYLTV
ncbi:hypothetical protein ACHAWX_005709 [Stephanocyclus meneghinianus]